MTAVLPVREDDAAPPTRGLIADRIAMVAPFFFACGWFSWGISTPSLWRDEVVTATMVSGSPVAILDVVQHHFDRVHFVYYELMWAWTQAFGTSEVSLRAPSLVAMAITAVVVFSIARRYVSRLGALCAGLVYVLLPSSSRYAQEARSTALIVAGVAIATWLMLRATETRNNRYWVAYILLMSGLCFLNLLVPLALIPHAAYLYRRVPVRTMALLWAPVFAASTFVALISFRQRAQVAWIAGPSPEQLLVGFGSLSGGAWVALVVAIGVVGALVWTAAGRRWSEVGWILAGLTIPFVLLAISYVKPMFVPRYVMFVAIFAALAMVIAAARIHVALPVLAVVAVLVLGWSSQTWLRTSASHNEDFRAAAAFLQAQTTRDDAIVYATPTVRMGLDYYAPKGLPATDPLAVPVRDGLLPDNAPCAADSTAAFARVWSLVFIRTSDVECTSGKHLVFRRYFGTLVLNLYE
ncbi:MAG: glycosyltransferase family 39 protein [Nocardiaceae bacterium]|nr:glycosyltransferase family 39 protein [Nocardiaceae bacterium]